MRHLPSRPNGELSPITLRIADACRVTGIGRSKFYELIKASEIEVIKVGAITLVPMTSIQALLDRSRPGNVDRSLGQSLRGVMHPFLANALLTAGIATAREDVRRDLSARSDGLRAKAEDALADHLVTALYEAEGPATAA